MGKVLISSMYIERHALFTDDKFEELLDFRAQCSFWNIPQGTRNSHLGFMAVVNIWGVCGCRSMNWDVWLYLNFVIINVSKFIDSNKDSN